MVLRYVGRSAVLVVGVLLSTGLPGVAYASGAHPPGRVGYRQVDLGTLGGATSSAAALNDRDEVVGTSDLAGSGSHAFLWRRGTLTDLGTLPGGTVSRATDINNRGEVVGSSTVTGGATHAVLWRRGVPVDLGTLDGGSSSAALAVNERGQVIGNAVTATGEWHGVLWQDGAATDLGEFQPVAINDRGQIAGQVTRIGQYAHGVLWERGVLTDLGSLGGFVYPSAINNRGEVVGRAGLTTASGALEVHCFRWHAGVLVDLGVPIAGQVGQSTGIDDRGRTVGYVQTPDGALLHPFLVHGTTATDLTTVGVSPGIVWRINNRGHLAGLRSTSGGPPLQPHAVLYV